MSVKMVTARGEEHGLIKTIANSVMGEGFKNMKPDAKAKAEKQRKEDSRMIKARYLNSRGMHERLTKPYCKYAGDRIETWHFIPGQIYSVPLGLVNEVNANPGLPRRSEVLDANGNPTKRDGETEKLHNFVPVEF
jgi:hypothetical protein